MLCVHNDADVWTELRLQKVTSTAALAGALPLHSIWPAVSPPPAPGTDGESQESQQAHSSEVHCSTGSSELPSRFNRQWFSVPGLMQYFPARIFNRFFFFSFSLCFLNFWNDPRLLIRLLDRA
jgi:hypothetical protein